MTTYVAEIEARIRALSHEQKVELVRALISDLDGAPDRDVERAWLDEARRRHQDVVEGRVQAVSGDDVFRNPRSRLKQ